MGSTSSVDAAVSATTSGLGSGGGGGGEGAAAGAGAGCAVVGACAVGEAGRGSPSREGSAERSLESGPIASNLAPDSGSRSSLSDAQARSAYYCPRPRQTAAARVSFRRRKCLRYEYPI